MEKPIAILSSVLFLQLAQSWRCLCWLGASWELRLGWSSLQGLYDRGQTRQGCCVCQLKYLEVLEVFVRSKPLFKLRQGERSLPPTATARRQQSQRQGEERCKLVYCQSVAEIPHVLKTLPSVQWWLFDSSVLQFLCETKEDWGLRRFLCLEVVSILQ